MTTSTLCQSAALGCIIAELFGIIVKTILSMVENVSNILHEPGACCRVASHDRAMLVPPGLDDVAGCVRLADLGAAWITETARGDRDTFPPATAISRERL